MAEHLVVISYDAFSQDNWEKAKTLPNLSKLIKKGAYSSQLKSIYPTLTYPIHATIVTGVHPNKHGIIHNNPFQPFVLPKDQEWYWFDKDIKVPTIYHLAKKNNLTTAGLLWPVTGKAPLKYNLPEIAAIKNESQVFKILRNGSILYNIDLELRFGKTRKGIQQPYLDDFTTLSAVDTIKRKKPNLLLIHLTQLDDAKHRFGTKSPEVEETIVRMDKRIGEIIQACQDAKIINDTTFLIVGDHGQFDVHKKIHLNNLLKEAGLISDVNGQLSWKAYLQSSGGSAYLFIKDDDKEVEKAALDTLEAALKSGEYGIESIYYRDKLDNLHVDKNIMYIVEGKKGYSFEDTLTKSTIVDLKEKNITYATHGYSPEKPDYLSNFVAVGKNIKENYPIGPVNMVDLAPTMAKILGFEMKNTDGRVLNLIFKK